MKNFSLLIFLTFLFINSLCANNKISVDSLRSIISGQSGEVYVNSLNEMSLTLLQNGQYDDANSFATEALI